jgi:hypothetical protein
LALGEIFLNASKFARPAPANGISRSSNGMPKAFISTQGLNDQDE